MESLIFFFILSIFSKVQLVKPFFLFSKIIPNEIFFPFQFFFCFELAHFFLLIQVFYINVQIFVKYNSMQLKIPNRKLKTSGVPTRKLLEINIETIIKQLELGGMLCKDEFQFIIQSSIKFQPNILKATSPAIIVGDIHGQFFDLVNIFRRYGYPPQTKYVFLGDYVDRGDFSIEVVTLLFLLKIKYPKSIYLLRGNHQCRVLTNTHNFKNQCKLKYNLKIYELVIILFEVLPICCIIDGKYFCVHAGISPALSTLQEIQKISRFCEIPEKGALCDLLWSDPTDQDKKQWTFNTMRSCSYFYSREHALNFLKRNNLEMIIRGHEVQLQGYKYMQFKKSNKKNVLTIFSAPNYCDKYNNLGAVALIQNQDIRLDTFRYVEHPYVLPNNMNIFQWSIGIISRQAVKILVELARTRLLFDKNGQSNEKIQQKDQLYTKMQAIKKALQQKQVCEKQIYKPKEVPPSNLNSQFEPNKCLVTILYFMGEKKKDQKGEGMPVSQEMKKHIKEEEKKIYGDLFSSSHEQKCEDIQKNDKLIQDQVNKQGNNASLTKTKGKAKKQKQIQSSQQISETQKSEVCLEMQKKNERDEEDNIQNTLIFGPKIREFAKILPKKK